jgi:hypothetical protein
MGIREQDLNVYPKQPEGASEFSHPMVFETTQLLPTGQPCWRVVLVPLLMPNEQATRVELVGTAEIDSAWLWWKDNTVLKIAHTIVDERRFDSLGILGDALEEAGCNNHDILAHCRTSGFHSNRCWLIDSLLAADLSSDAR